MQLINMCKMNSFYIFIDKFNLIQIEGEDRPGSPVKGLLSESGTERDLESLTQYSMLQQAHDSECHQLQERIETLLDENFIIKKQVKLMTKIG